MTIEFKSSFLDDMINNGLSFFTDKPKYQTLIASRAIQYQEIENELVKLMVLKDVDQVAGDALYKLGAMLGENYAGQTTENYRIAIKARIFINFLSSKTNEILVLLSNTSYIERITAFTLRSIVGLSTDQARSINEALQRIKPAGVKADLLYNSYQTTNQFRLDDTTTIKKGQVFYKPITNRAVDGDCESSDVNKWYAYDVGATSEIIPTKSSSQFISGSQSLRIETLTTETYFRNLVNQVYNTEYFLSFYIYSEDPIKSIRISKSASEHHYKTSIPYGVWVNVKCRFTALTTFYIYVYPTNPFSVYYIDDYQLIEV